MIPHRSNEVSKEAAPHRLALAFLLGLLAVLIVAVTANAYVTKKTRTTLADFDSGTFLLTGLLTIPPDVESVQLMPIGLTGDWYPTQSLPRPLYDMGTTSSRDFIYILGGTEITTPNALRSILPRSPSSRAYPPGYNSPPCRRRGPVRRRPSIRSQAPTRP